MLVVFLLFNSTIRTIYATLRGLFAYYWELTKFDGLGGMRQKDYLQVIRYIAVCRVGGLLR